MPYRIIIQDAAREDLDDIFAYIVTDSPQNAPQLINRILNQIGTLAAFPKSHSLAPENEDFAEEIRHLIVGPYRVLYTIRDATVHVLHVRHGARLPWRPTGR